jgi:hypothetical protein
MRILFRLFSLRYESEEKDKKDIREIDEFLKWRQLFPFKRERLWPKTRDRSRGVLDPFHKNQIYLIPYKRGTSQLRYLVRDT